MYVRYKKNIQENDLPRKRVRKASKIAGSGGQHLEIRCPERGRKLIQATKDAPRGDGNTTAYCESIMTFLFENKMPREGTEILLVLVSSRWLC